MKAVLKIFKAVPIEKKSRKKISNEILKKTIRYGFLFTPEVVNNFSDKELDNLINIIKKEIGISAEQMNNAFHESWQKIKDASIEQLVIEQMIHYFTTYGFESLGIYNKESVYIPNEKLEIPELKEDIPLIIIKGYTKKELKDKLLELLKTGIALKDDTIKDVIDIALLVDINGKEISEINNKEVKIALYNYLNLVPENPIEFLRYILYRSTGKTLLIKDKETIEAIGKNKNIGIYGLFFKYDKEYGSKRLAEIFYRFKPLFLAFRTNPKLNKEINKIRRLAVKYHKPMSEDFLNEITAKIKNNKDIDKHILDRELKRINIFRKTRLANALKYRTKDVNSILYKIRNGKSFATDFDFNKKERARDILKIVVNSIVNDIKNNVHKKKIFIPDFITYTLPATEKQFTGNYPSGTYITVPKDMIFGVHWNDAEHHYYRRIDLDLSLLDCEDGKIGWDADYRTEDRSILFSGDMTSAPAPNGASEFFYIKRRKSISGMLIINYYNYDSDIEVPFDIIIAKSNMNSLGKNHMIDPNNVLTIAQSKMDKRQKLLGLVIVTTNECRFYFSETVIGNSITSSDSDYMQNARQYLFDYYKNGINLNDILIKAGASLVDNKKDCDIDLSPDALEKDSIINLLKKG